MQCSARTSLLCSAEQSVQFVGPLQHDARNCNSISDVAAQNENAANAKLGFKKDTLRRRYARVVHTSSLGWHFPFSLRCEDSNAFAILYVHLELHIVQNICLRTGCQVNN